MEEKINLEDLAEAYFPKLEQEGYEYPEDEYADWMKFVDLLCSTWLIIKSQSYPESYRRIGVLYEDETLMDALAPHEDTGERIIYSKIFALFQYILGREGKGSEQNPLPFYLLCRLGKLNFLELFAVILALLPELNRKYERAFAILSEDGTQNAHPTLGLIYDMSSLFLPVNYGDLASFTDEDSFIRRVVFMNGKDVYQNSQSVLSMRLVLRPRVRDFLLDNFGQMGKLYPYAEILEGTENSQALAGQKQIDEVDELYRGLLRAGKPGLILLVARAGAGKKFLLKQVSARTGCGFLCLHMDRLMVLNYEERMDLLEDAVSKCTLEGLELYLDGFEVKDGEKYMATEILTFLQKYIAIIFLSSKDGAITECVRDKAWYQITMERPSGKEQHSLWSYYLKNNNIVCSNKDVLDVITSKYSLLPGQIVTLVDKMLVKGVKEVTEELLSGYIREACHVDFGDRAKRLVTGFTWKDLELNEESQAELERIDSYIKKKAVVYENYGFAKKLPYGRGTSVLFYGPPGTGKTMAAAVLANEWQMDIYRINLSQISSKYIGETQKNLSAVFDAGKNSNVILFFDEADALFARRTEVGNANDKHANEEAAFLLQKIEEYDGICFLATNNLNNFDPAFRRRISFIVPMNLPTAEIRQQLWEHAFPEETPLSAIDFDLFAQNLELSGSSIKSAAVNAAFASAASGNPVTMEDLIVALDRENYKNGRLTKTREALFRR